MSVARPLAGIRILDLSRLLPGPFCTLYLAQMGAEVIKLEEPGCGDYARGVPDAFAQVNRGKKSVVLDLRSAADREQFLRLAETAHVVLESFRPGVMDRLGCGYEVLHRRNPGLIYAALTGYGQTGPCRDWPGHDANYLAMAGVLDQIGVAGGPPALCGVPIADLAGGALTCAIGILSAVIGARRSGKGCFLDVAMLDGTLALQPLALSALRQHARLPLRGRGPLSGALPNYQVYRCRDGRHLMVGAVEPKFFIGLLKALANELPSWLRRWLLKVPSADGGSGNHAVSGLGGLQLDPFRVRWVTTFLRPALAAVFLTRTRDYWASRLQHLDACVTPVRSLDETLADEQIRQRGMLVDDAGKPAFALPFTFSGQRLTIGPAPDLGQHTREVLHGITSAWPASEN